MAKPIRTKPIPTCEECGIKMILRRPPRHEQTWDEFWGCRNFPECRFTLEIGDDGRPIYKDGDEWDAYNPEESRDYS